MSEENLMPPIREEDISRDVHTVKKCKKCNRIYLEIKDSLIGKKAYLYRCRCNVDIPTFETIKEEWHMDKPINSNKKLYNNGVKDGKHVKVLFKKNNEPYQIEKLIMKD